MNDFPVLSRIVLAVVVAVLGNVFLPHTFVIALLIGLCVMAVLGEAVVLLFFGGKSTGLTLFAGLFCGVFGGWLGNSILGWFGLHWVFPIAGQHVYVRYGVLLTHGPAPFVAAVMDLLVIAIGTAVFAVPLSLLVSRSDNQPAEQAGVPGTKARHGLFRPRQTPDQPPRT